MEYLGHKLVVADPTQDIVGMYFCSVCGIKIFIGNENDLYKQTSYGNKIVYFNHFTGWINLNTNCNEIQIKRLLE